MKISISVIGTAQEAGVFFFFPHCLKLQKKTVFLLLLLYIYRIFTTIFTTLICRKQMLEASQTITGLCR